MLLIMVQSHAMKSPIHAHIFGVPQNIEPSSVTNAGHYILSMHVMRTLTKLNKVGDIVGDLATNWSSTNDKKRWTITINHSEFSDGSEVKSSDVVASIRRQIALKSAVHFDFSQIKKIESENDKTITIVLKNPNSHFAFDLSKPEFGILHRTDVSKEKGLLTFKITSGPYFLIEIKNKCYYLKRNFYYMSDVLNNEDLTICSANKENTINNLFDKKINFVSSADPILDSERRNLNKLPFLKTVKPHIGFSYWISLNPKSHLFENIKSRYEFQQFMRNFKTEEMSKPDWELADQIYLPDGDGRPNKSELSEIWKQIENTKFLSNKAEKKVSIRLLPLKFTNKLIEDVIQYLSTRYNVELMRYSSEEELIKLISENNFDIKISANDFSSTDLYENLKTTFNKTRPYVFLTEDNMIHNLMKKAGEEEDRKKRSEYFKKIGIELLKSGLVFPIAHQRVYFYLSKKLNIDSWATTYPEISFWKIKIND